MKDESKTKAQLIQELHDLRTQLHELGDPKSRQPASALIESEEGLKALLNATTASVILIDLESTILMANTMAAERFSMGVDELIGMRMWDIIPPDLAQTRQAQVKQVAESGQPVRFQDTRGEYILDNTLYPVLDNTGNVNALAVYANDITEKTRSEKTISEQNKFLENLLESLTHPLYVIDVQDYTVVKANSAAGYPVGEEKSRCHALTHHRENPCDDPEHPCPLKEVLRTRKPVVVNHIHYDVDGNARNVEVHGFPIFDDEGHIVQMIEYNLDITKRQQAVDALQVSERKFRSLFDAMNQGIAIHEIVYNDSGIAVDYTLLDVNPAYESIVGLSREDVIGNLASELYGLEEPPYLEVYAGVADKGEPVQFETFYPPLDKHFSISAFSPRQGRFVTVFSDITDRQQAEEALQESEERYRLLVNNIPNVTWISSSDGTTTFISPNVEKVYGYSPEEIYQAGEELWFKRIHPEDLGKVQETYSRLFVDESGFDIEYRIKRKDGQWIWLHDRAITSYEEGGKQFAYGVFSDITERKQAEEALRESEEKFSKLFQTSPNALIISTLEDGLIIEINEAGAQSIGLPREEIVDKTSLEIGLVDEETRAQLIGYIQEQGRYDAVEIPVTLPTGEQRFGLFHGQIIKIGDQDCLFQTTIDITDRKQAEEALRDSEEQYRLLITNIPDVVWLSDFEGKPVFISPVVEEVYGYSPDEVLEGGRKLWYGSIHPDDLEQVQTAHAALAEDEAQFDIEYRVRRKDGKWIWIHDRAIRSYKEEGTGYAYGMFSDITERKRGEDLTRIQRDLGVSLGKSIDLHEVLRLCLRAGLEASGLDCGGIYIVDPTTGAMDLPYHEGLPEDFVAAAAHYEADSPSAQLVMAGNPVYTSHKEMGIPLKRAVDKEDLKAIAVVPIKHANRVVGCLNVASHSYEEVPQYARNMLETIASQIGDAIANKQAEEALRFSEEKFSRIFHFSPDSITISGFEDHILLDVNDAFESISGYSRAEALGKSGVELTLWTDVEQDRMLRKLEKEGFIRNEEIQFKLKDGSNRLFQFSAGAIELHGETYAVTISSDITERKQAQDAIQQRTEDLDLINGVNEILNRGENLSKVIDLVASETSKMFSAYEAGVYLIGENPNVLELQNLPRGRQVMSSLQKLINRELPQMSIPRKDNSLLWQVITSQETQIINHSTKVKSFIQEHVAASEEAGIMIPKAAQAMLAQLAATMGIKSLMLTPLTSEGRVIGLLSIARKSQFTEEDLSRFETIAQQLTAAIMRKKAEEALLESEERYRAIFEDAAIGVALVNPEGQTIARNPALYRMLGYSPEEMQDMTFQDITHPEDVEAELITFQELIKGKRENYQMEKRYFRKGGEVLWTRLTVSLVRGSTNEPLFAVGMIEDITERKQAEESLQESEARLRTLFETSPDGVIIDQNGLLVYANPAYQQMFGIKNLQDRLGESYSLMIAPHDLDRVLAISAAREAGEDAPTTYEYTGQRADGSEFPVEVTAARFEYEGSPATMAILRDITERKQAEEALRESEERFRNMMEQSPFGIEILTPDGQISQVNPAWRQLWGLSQEGQLQVLKKYNMLRDEQLRELGVIQLVEKAFAGEPVILPLFEYNAVRTKEDLEIANVKGKKLWIQAHLYPVKSGDGEILNVINMYEDITERKQAEDALRESEQVYRTLFDSSADAVMVLDTEKFLGCNPEALRLFGLKDEAEFIGLHPSELSPPKQPDGTDSQTAADERIATALEKGQNKFEWMHRRKNGEDFLAEVSLTAFPFKGQQILQAIVRDITDRKHAEDALRFTQFSVDTSPDAALWARSDGRFISANNASLRLTGYTIDEIRNMSVFNLDVARSAEEWPDWWQQLKELGASTRETQIRAKDGKLIPIEITTNFMEFEGEEFVCGFARDITLRKQAEESLKASEEKFRNLFEFAPDGVYLTDLKGTFVDGNLAAEMITGYSRRELIGKNFLKAQLLPKKEIPKATRLLARSAKGLPTGPDEFTMIRKDGSRISAEIGTYPIQVEGEVLILGVARDITERKEADGERQQLFQDVVDSQAKLKALSSELVKTQERERHSISRDLHDDVGQELSAVSYLLEHLKTKAEETGYQDDLGKALAMLDGTLQKVRDISLDLRPAMLDTLGLAATIRWFIGRQRELGKLNIDMDDADLVERPPAEVEIVCFRIVQEAITNIIRHAKAGKVDVELSESENELQLLVRDDGKGFDVEQALSAASAGKSLGLLGMQERAELVGGRIELASKHAQGTEIHAYFPLS
jgi:PAS domain S-box-containing protein